MNFPWHIVITLAWRNLWRNYRRTLIMLAAIVVGVWSMIFMTAMMRGMVDEMIRGSTSTLLGHAQIHHHLFRDDPNISNSMPPPSARLKAVLAQESVVAWTQRVRVPAIISSERESLGVSLVGVNPHAEEGMSFLADSIEAGRHLESPEDKGLILGARLAERLETKLGKRVVIMSQDPDNNIVDRGFRVVGIYETDPSNIEKQFVFTGLNTAQQFLNMGEQISEIEILGQNYRDTDSLIAPIQQAMDAGLSLEPWYEIDSYLGSMLPMMDGFILVWIVVVFIALSFGLVNTLAMAVFERVREIGLMLALGMRPGAIRFQVLAESLMLLTTGLMLGNLLAWISIVPLESGIDISAVGQGLEMAGMSSTLYPSLKIKDMFTATGIVIILGLVASLLPAWRASRLEPIKALTKT